MYPCTDKIHFETQSHKQMEKHSDCGTHDTNETCSPLCQCVCCSVSIVYTDIFQILSTQCVEIVNKEEHYFNKHESQFYDFWHPPRV